MKNKVLSLGIFVLMFVLGVGYATVSSVGFNFGGTARVEDYELRVDIEGVEDTKVGTATITHTLEEHGNEDHFAITNMKLNEEIVMTYTIKNHETDVDALLKEAITLSLSNDEYFDASYSISNTKLKAGASTTIVVKVKLTKTPIIPAHSSTDINFKINAEPVKNATVETIDFTINGTSYKAEVGMTWAEWVDSIHNYNDEFYVLGNNINSKHQSTSVHYADNYYNYVYTDDEIEATDYSTEEEEGINPF